MSGNLPPGIPDPAENVGCPLCGAYDCTCKPCPVCDEHPLDCKCKKEKPNTFTCAACGDEFEKGWDDSEADAEYERLFPVAHASGEEREIVCDDCFNLLMGKQPEPEAIADEEGHIDDCGKWVGEPCTCAAGKREL